MGANIGFDMAIADVWLPWLHGQPVVVLETNAARHQLLPRRTGLARAS